ncbi:tape measure protein [Limosilactobacillus reuteri]|uniref:tape measure protein n=1 Tax=Limosilactobacillus reuteri TaxID=1598 RepID=UPI001E503A27|nr:tape measure protein [Limosilactobacillus reuteri]MCC4440011.1 tape measure protein [Limosilactobacillus reuteri]
MAQTINTVMATDIALNTLPANQALSGLRRAVDAISKSYEAQARQAENAGKAAQANALRHEGLSQAIDKQTKLVHNLADQQAHLAEVAQNQAGQLKNLRDREKEVRQAMAEEADAVGKTSDKYNELKTALKNIQQEQREAKYAPSNLLKVSRQLENAKIKLTDLQREDQRYTPTIGRRISNSLDRANQKLAESKHNVGGFKSVLMGTFAGQALTSAASGAWNAIKGGIAAATQAGINFTKQNQIMMATWQTLTGTKTGAKGMVDDITTVSNKLGQPIKLTDELEQQFYHVFNNRQDSTQLTQSFETMGDAIGLTSDRLQQVGQDFTHMMSSSTLHLGELNQITDAFPMFSEALLKYERQVQHNGSLTMNQLRQQISAGKIQSQDAVNVMNQLGQKYSKASEHLMSTLPGMARQIKSKLQQELGNAMGPLMNSASPVYKAVSNWVKDKKTDDEFKQLGQKLNTSVQNVLKAYTNGGNASTITNGLNRMVQGIGNAIQSVSQFLVRNRTTIQATFSLIGNAGKLAFVVIKQSIKDVIGFFSMFTGSASKSGSSSQSMAQKIQGLSNALKALSKNQVAIKVLAGMLSSLFMINKASQFASFIQKLATGPLAKLVGKLVNIRDAFSKLASAAKKSWSALKTVATFSKSTAVKSFTMMKTATIKTASAFKSLAVASKRAMMNGMRSLATMAKGVKLAAQGVRAFNLALKSNPIIAVISLVVALIGVFVELYKHNAKFRNFVNGLVSAVVNIAKKFIQYTPPFLMITMFMKLYKHSKTFRNFVNVIVKTCKDVFTGLFNWFKEKFDWLKKKGKELWDSIKHPFGGGSQPAYASGTSGTTEDQIAMVNDARSQHYREGLYYNGVLMPFPNKRNITTFLPKGAQVINGDAMHELMHGKKNIPHYADGIGMLNSWIAGQSSYAQGQRSAVFQAFLAKINKQYAKLHARFLQTIKKARLEEFKIRKKEAEAIAKARARFVEAMSKARLTLTKSMQKAALKPTEDARDSARDKARQTYNNAAGRARSTYSKALDAAQTAMEKAVGKQGHIIFTANLNLDRLERWRNDNIAQFQQANAAYAQGGIADKPSIFGEAGPEAAIPLDQMQQGNAWSLLQRVVNFYAGNSNGGNMQGGQSADNAKLDQLHRDLTGLTSLLRQVISGQGAQIQATKGIQGYDSTKAGQDVSKYINNAFNTGLTM